jgi:coenzyme F420-reducing hydrogenase delta subunit/ferredoxin
MNPMLPALRRTLAWADAGLNRLYGWRYNPLYHSGALVLALFVVLLVTGIYLLFFYHISAPYESIVALDRDVWLGRWSRGVHRYASDAAVVAAVFHALRMLVHGRTWGPRTLAWISGLVLFAFVLLCGWTGFVMVWDVQGQVLAQAGARLFDLLPIFGEPISRAFTGERAIPGAFFFLNLFAHVALPIGLFILVWVHVSRLARPGLFPPRQLTWTVVGALSALAVVWPVATTPPADLFALPGAAPFDWFYAFWLPLAHAVSPLVFWGIGLAVAALGLAIPWLTRPRIGLRSPPSRIDERLCTGCEQCYLDCPYEAIAMVERADASRSGKSAMVGRVDPTLCVSCGLCAGSCAPMGVGPAGRTGRAQLGVVRDFVVAHQPGGQDVVLIACEHGAGGITGASTYDGSLVYPVSCGGNLHTSVVEFLLRSGAGGVLIVSCPPRDCRHREGPKWLEARLFHQREAELRDRVDRRRVRLVHASAGEPEAVRAALAAFRAEVAMLGAAAAEPVVDLERLCELAEAGAEESP